MSVDYVKELRNRRRRRMLKLSDGGSTGGDGGYSPGPSQAAGYGISGMTAGQGSDAAGMGGGPSTSSANTQAAANAQAALAAAQGSANAQSNAANVASILASLVPGVGLAAKGAKGIASLAGKQSASATPAESGPTTATQSMPGGSYGVSPLGVESLSVAPQQDTEEAARLRDEAAAENAATATKIVGRLAPWTTPAYAQGGSVQQFADGGTAETDTTAVDPRLSQFVPKQAQLDEIEGYGSAVEGGMSGFQQAQAQAAKTGGAQQALANQLGQQALGRGPNPALEQLKQTTGQNIQRSTGMVASQKGINPALAARVAALAGAGANQTAAGQAAIQAAQQQLAAQQLQAQTLASQRGLDINQQQQALGMYGTSGQLLQGQNLQRIQALAGPQTLEQLTAAQNADVGLSYEQLAARKASEDAAAQRQLVGSLINAAGSTVPTLWARGGQIDFRVGGNVPGRARVQGDSEQNDTVPALVSPGEIVLPRSVAQAPDAEQEAADFVSAIKNRRRESSSAGGYGRVLAKQREIEQRLAALEKMSDGGEVDSEEDPEDIEDPDREDPGVIESIKRWFTSGGSQKSGRAAADAINAAIPESLSARNAVLAQRRKMALLDEIDRAGRR
jgi:hypothetical protein